MKSADLLAEFRAAVDGVKQPHADRMAALGISYELMDDLSPDGLMPFGVGLAAPVDAGLYEPGEGQLHVIQPVYAGDQIIDLIAWRSADPTEWSLRTGLAAFLGDVDQIVEVSLWSPEVAINLWSTPLDWLKAGGDGIAIVNWGATELEDLRRLPTITIHDHAVADAFRAALSRPACLPRIIVSEGIRNAA